MQYKIITAFITFAFILISIDSYAQRAVNIRELNFGKVAKPTSGNVSIVVRRNGSVGGGTTAIMLDTTAVSAGRDRISGSRRNDIQISFDECSSNSALGLQLRRFVANYSGVNFINSANGLPPAWRGQNLTYGATLVINSSTPGGVLTPCYNIDINYD
ncbi:MAG: DUF4402 domain-containing protein [Rickettsiales bacterium]|nr:DUF4402 domain-containing protein [Pseudomonadota bacterium]MDA0965597.1 DUF4402 domain-containing protein [Pseudomonadota bacterium]MDG4542921.1 DUF4402 domain-containing protein [Rickettsiales bacterium]MDG4544631.1 DUF4402 domain-containing protein [Rickettsiales bacterium]MDG4546753.1 DUF4402 domain-containing protein [Rickettsiales bacterium]